MAETESELVGHVKSRKLRYFSHVMRLSYDRVENSLMVGLLEGTRGRGKPRIGWFDNTITLTGLSGAGVL